jgi:membrane-associated phospholipid phosphatase
MDDALVIWLNRAARSSPWTCRTVSALARGLAGVEILLMVLMAMLGRRQSALRMIGAVGLVYVMSEGLGAIWPRERPFARLPRVQTLAPHSPERSFPSRHVASGLVMAAIGHREHSGLGALMRGVAWLLGITRVAAGIHYPTDVLAGAALGTLVGGYLHNA